MGLQKVNEIIHKGIKMSNIIQFPKKKINENTERLMRIRKSLDNINLLMRQLKEMGWANEEKKKQNNIQLTNKPSFD